jgi:hypothetical protein
MKKAALLLLLCSLAIPVNFLHAQEKPQTESSDKRSEEKTPTSLRVQIVFSEFEGDKKLSSLSYTLPIQSDTGRGSIRMGLRVPVVTGSASPGSAFQNQYQYVDVGSNLDGRATKTSDGRFLLHLSLERSSAYASKEASEKTSGNQVIQTFRTEFDLLIRDGQTIQSTMAADPVSGRITKVDVTLTVVK